MTIDLKCDIEEAKNSNLPIILANTPATAADAISGKMGDNVYICVPFYEFSDEEQEEISRLMDTVFGVSKKRI